MIFRPSESFSANSSTDFLSVIDPSIMRPKNRTGIEWIDGMNKEKSVGLDGSETQKGELFSDLPFLIMKLRDLSTRNSIPAHCIAVHFRKKNQSEVEKPQLYLLARCPSNDQQLMYVDTRTEDLMELRQPITTENGIQIFDTLTGQQKGGGYFCW